MGSAGAERLSLNLAIYAVACWRLGLLSAAFAIACGYHAQHQFYKATGPRYNALLKTDFDLEVGREAAEEEAKPNEKRDSRIGGKPLGLLALA